jgi:8-oxo-dGTP pyrophosphatase MutT (NUDIX family)
MVHPTRLDLPKGHIRPGESEIECALRELEEETAIPARDVALDPDFRFTTTYPVSSKRYPGERCDKSVVIFLGRLLRPVNIVVTEHVGHRWVPWNPPHAIQQNTIDPLLFCLTEFLDRRDT